MTKKNKVWRFLVYLFRWQTSGIILAPTLMILNQAHPVAATIVANAIGGICFYFIDRMIFKGSKAQKPLWEIRKNSICADCGKHDVGYRVVEWGKYNRTAVENPEFRCCDCANIKFEQVRKKAGSGNS